MSEQITRVRIELNDTDPLVWRELDLPLTSTLAMLHDNIQAVMLWWDYHLYEFRIGDRVYSVPDPEDEWFERKVYNSKNLRLETLIKRGVREFLYVYDFGDNWEHRITLGEVRQGDAGVEYPRFVAGERRAPPEDVGGISGFEDYLEATADPEHEEHQEYIDWRGGPYDPEDFEENTVVHLIEYAAARRRGPLSKHRTDKRKSR